MEGVGRQNWVRGRIPIFRNIHLHGKTVKSTHGHTKKKPTQLFRTTPLPWSDRAKNHQVRRAYPGATAQKTPTLELRGTYPGATKGKRRTQ